MLSEYRRKELIDYIDDDLLAYLLGENILEQFLLGIDETIIYEESKAYFRENKVVSIGSAFSWRLNEYKCSAASLPIVNWAKHRRNFYKMPNK